MTRELSRRRLLQTAACALVLSSGRLRAAAVAVAESPERNEKVVSVAKLVREVSGLVIWPAGSAPAGAVLRFGVLGADPFGVAVAKALEEFGGSGARREVVRSEQPADLAKCQVVFAYNPTQGRFDDLVALTEGRPVLTILFSEDRFAQGAMIELFKAPAGLRYFINHAPFRRARFSPMPGLLDNTLRGRPR